MSDPIYGLLCAAITNGCRSAFAADGPPNIDLNELDRAVPEDRRMLDLLLMSGWRKDHGLWVCANHEPAVVPVPLPPLPGGGSE